MPSSSTWLGPKPGCKPTTAVKTSPLRHGDTVTTEQGRSVLERLRLRGFQPVEPLPTCLLGSGLLRAEPLLEVGCRFGKLEFVNACPVCYLNPSPPLYHL